jgi:hypothetical protein
MGGIAIVETKFDNDTYFGGSIRQTFITQSYIPNLISGKDPKSSALVEKAYHNNEHIS